MPSRKMTANPFYGLAKKGCLESSLKLVKEILPPVRLKHPAIVCPVIKETGNRIPLAMAIEIARQNILSAYTDKIILTNRKSPPSMGERFYSLPHFFGEVLKANYCLVDDYYTTGKTLITLKRYIEHNGGSVTEIICLASSKATGFELNRHETKMLRAKFPNISQYFDLKEITKPMFRFLISHNSLQSLHMRINETTYYNLNQGMPYA